jgi:protein-tyrosine phosphatase
VSNDTSNDRRTPKIRQKGHSMSHVDLHLHLLPGLDDGPADEAASLEHAARMVAEGVHEATVTPHIGHPWFPGVDPETVAERTRLLQQALDRERLDLRLHTGGELHPGAAADLAASELELVAQGPAGARWVLLEVPFAGVDLAFAETAARIRANGYGLVIAHPERADGLLAGPGMAILRREMEHGSVLQVNVCSLIGMHGDEARETARRLLRSGLAYVLASDGHGGARGHTLGAGPAAARGIGASELQSWQLTQANPRFLLRHGLPRTSLSPTRSRLPGADAWRPAQRHRVASTLATARDVARSRRT